MENLVAIVWLREGVDSLLKRFQIVNVRFSGISTKKVVQSVLQLGPKGKQIALFRPRMVFPLLVLLRMGRNPFEMC